MRTLLAVVALSILSSCSSYIDRVHDQIDRESNQGKYTPTDKFDLYRNNKTADKKVRPSGAVSSKDQKNLEPMIRRQYVPEEQAKRRTTANDLNDNQSDGSLWASDNANAFLFSSDTSKKSGDIVLINVQDRLKSDISAVLKKAYPPFEDGAKKKAEEQEKKEGQEGGDGQKQANAGKTKEDANNAEDGVYDRISSVVIEEINKDHVLLRGRKGLLYRGSKRTVEVQALVARKDINTEDSINSDRILETSVNVVR